MNLLAFSLYVPRDSLEMDKKESAESSIAAKLLLFLTSGHGKQGHIRK